MAASLVLLHGFTHTGVSWEWVRAALPRGYRALAPDIRGHGAMAARRPATLGGVLADLAAGAPDRFVLGGYSMGGRIALHAALAPELGDRIERLVLIGASPGLADPTERDARRQEDERLAGDMERMSIEEVEERWAAGTPILSGQPPHVREAARRDRLRNIPEGLAAALRGLGTGALPSLWERLGELAVPVALVVGERDRKFREIAESMAQRIPRAEAVVVPGTGHAVHLEAPERVAEILLAG